GPLQYGLRQADGPLEPDHRGSGKTIETLLASTSGRARVISRNPFLGGQIQNHVRGARRRPASTGARRLACAVPRRSRRRLDGGGGEERRELWFRFSKPGRQDTEIGDSRNRRWGVNPI